MCDANIFWNTYESSKFDIATKMMGICVESNLFCKMTMVSKCKSKHDISELNYMDREEEKSFVIETEYKWMLLENLTKKQNSKISFGLIK